MSVGANTFQTGSREPLWLSRPDPLLLLTAIVSAGYLHTSYYQLNITDKFQLRIVCSTLLASILVGLLSGYDFLTISLMLVPWVLYTALIMSDALHFGLRLRTHQLGQEHVGEEKQKTLRHEEESIDR